MLSIAQVGSASYYLDLAKEDYFLNGGEPQGRWFGKGAERLDLSDGKVVARDELRAILAGVMPNEPDKHLVQQQKNKKRQTGWDLCFSAPKSVSVLWSQADPKTRDAIQKAQSEAVKASLAYLEKVALETRRGHGGANHELTAGGFFALFEHGTSRARDPQLHTHALVSNLCFTLDGGTKTIFSPELYRHKMAAGALYRAELAHQLKERLNLTVERVEDWFEVAGMSEEVRDHFSQRAQVIRELAAQNGWTSTEVKAQLAVATREVKGHIDREKAFEIWHEEGQKIGFSRFDADKLLLAGEGKDLGIYGELRERVREDIVEAVRDKLDEKVAYFRERDLVRYVAEECQGYGFGADEVLGIAEGVKRELTVLDDPHSLRPYLATKEMMTLEAKSLAQAERLLEKQSHPVHGEHIAGAIDKVNQQLKEKHGDEASLSNEQLKAIYHTVENPSSLAMVQGLAGTGKTEMLTVGKLAWERSHYDVFGCAISGKAARGLQNATGIESMSVAKMLHRTPKLTSKTIVVVDEAAMVNSKLWASLQEKIEAAGAKLVAVGDRHQVQSIGAGAPFNSLLDRHQHVELTDIRRQKHEWMRDALRSMVEGDVDEALGIYAEHGCIVSRADREAAISSLVFDWSTSRDEDLSKTLVLCGTRAEANILNERIQKLRGILGEVDLGGVKNDLGQTLRGRDRVLFTENNREMGVDNGDTGTIVDIQRPRGIMGKAKLIVELDRTRDIGFFPTKNGAWVPILEKRVRVEVDLKNYRDIELGYALTTHKAQGATVENAFVLGGSMMQDREMTYTQLSRVKDEVKMYLSEAEMSEGLATLVEMAERSHEKNLAHDIEQTEQQRIRQEAEELMRQQEERQRLQGQQIKV